MSDDLVREKLRLYADDVAPPQLPPFAGVTARRRRRRTQRLLSGTSALLVVALVVVLAAVLGGGSSNAPASGLSSELIGGKWSLSSITTGGAVWKAPADNGFSLAFTASSYTGNDSCNGTSGSVSYGRDTVHLGSGAMTAIGCVGDDRARMQEAFQLLIDKDLPVMVAGGTLTITAGQTVLALNRLQPAAPVDFRKVLPGTTWTLVSIGTTGKDVSSSIVGGNTVNTADIVFKDGEYAASDGCNTSNGPVAYTATTLTLGQGASTALKCLAPNDPVAPAYAKVLTGTVTPTLAGDTLTIPNGATSLTFTRAAVAAVPTASKTLSVASTVTALEVKLIGTGWKLESLAGSGVTWRPVPTSTASVSFSVDGLEAGDGCSSLTAPLTYDDTTSTIAVPTGATIGMGVCAEAAPGPPPGTDAPSAFLDALQKSLLVTVEGDAMTLSGSGITMTFSSSAVADRQTNLEGYDWRLTSLTQEGVVTQVPASPPIRFYAASGGYALDTGCQLTTGTATYTAAGVALTGGGWFGTLCTTTPLENQVQQAFSTVVDKATVAVLGPTLTISSGTTSLSFDRHTAKPMPEPTGLQKEVVGPTWQLTKYNAQGSWVTLPASAKATLQLSATGFASNDGCNTTSGYVTYGKSSVTYRPIGTTDGLCAPGTTNVEVIRSLDGEVDMSVKGDTLTVKAQGKDLVYTRGPAELPYSSSLPYFPPE